MIIAGIVVAGAGYAQTLSVESMTMEPMDLSAGLYPRVDRNGVKCALVKVQIPLEGMAFEGNVMGDVVNKAGEYWVYLTAGTKFFNIKHRSVRPLMLTFADYKLGPLQAKTTYVLRLSAPASPATATPTQEVTFRLTPPQAILIIDDVEREVVGGTARVTLTHGNHRCSVSYPGYKAISEQIVVNSGLTKRIYELDPKGDTTPPAAAQKPTTPPSSAPGTQDAAAIVAEANKAYNEGYYNRAYELYQKIPDNTSAQVRIGYMYSNGQGVSQDYAEAFRWYRRAAEQGNALGQISLGIMYEAGQGVNQDYAEAVRWYRRAAEQGDAEGQSNLGNMYRIGWGVSQDYAEAVRWYRLAAEQDDAAGQTNLGRMYETGRGVSQDYAEAVRWYRRAAKQGEAIGQNNLGNMYSDGKGVTKDYAESAKWFKKSADQGCAIGCANWGWSLYYGHGVAQDRKAAYHWLKKAADAGRDWAKKFIAEHEF